MSKLSKFLRSPGAFFQDALDKQFPARRARILLQTLPANGKPTAALIGFNDWKKAWMDSVLPDYNLAYLGHSVKAAREMTDVLPTLPNAHVFTWSYKYPDTLMDVVTTHHLPLTYVEDGFIRSVGLGATNKSRPMSLVFDTKGMHFDRSKVTDLDDLLNHHSFTQAELASAKAVMAALKDGLTKYISLDQDRDLKAHLGLDDRKVILVLGQVEDDLSIAYGMETFMSANDLVARVALENPDAHILYRPHPESLAVAKPHYSNPADVAHLCHVIGPEWSLRETFQAAQEAHTMTSLTGLEAAVAGLDVHTYGMPFYAGWGFTTDHGLASTEGKRLRSRSLEDVVAGAYVLYARYYHPTTGAPITVDEALVLADRLKTHMRRVATVRAAHMPSVDFDQS